MSRLALRAVLLGMGLSLMTTPAVADDGVDKPAVLRRILWEDGARADPGIHIRSMERDGSDVREIYDSPHGFTLELALDPAGRRVAFSPCCRTAMPLLVVVPVLGGKAKTPLKKNPARFDFVGGIGWSPNGRRIAFEGFSGSEAARVTTIWTVRPNGKGLRRILELPTTEHDGPPSNEYLAWTDAGILYSDGTDLRAARPGRSTLVMERVGAVRASGDGTHLLLFRPMGRGGSLWLSDAAAADAHKLYSNGDPDHATRYYDVVPSYDATELLAQRYATTGELQTVTWPVDAKPAQSEVLTLPDMYTMAVTWN